MKKLENDLAYLKYRVAELESSSASVNAEGESYDVARTKFGVFPIIVRGVTPYLDGYKVKFGIGNLTAATFHGAKLNVTWGLPPGASLEDSLGKIRHRSVDLVTTINPGSFSVVEVILAPAKPDEIKRIMVGIELNQMSLR